MQPRDGPGANHSDAASAARARLAAELRHHGRAVDAAVLKAFARVPRHIFVPEVGPAAAYRDEALVIKCGADGLPISSSSQPAMMAIMLDQLGLRAGHRVLEIGTGSGYNAAVMSEVVGDRGQVVSIDIDPELVARATASLARAGYHAVVVKCADGGFGDPDGAPFDRIIVTAGAWDIAPAWLNQVGRGGLLVLPLSVRSIQLSVALQRTADLPGHGGGDSELPMAGLWQSTSAWRCGFVRMLGAFAGPEEVLRLDQRYPLFAQMADGMSIDGGGLQNALARPAADQVVPLSAGLADLADLDLWLTLTEPELGRVTLLAAPGGWFELASLLPLGGLVVHPSEPGLGVAVLLPAGVGRDRALTGSSTGRSSSTSRSQPGVLVRGYGPAGAELAAHLAGRTALWARLGRPGVADMYLTVLEGAEAGSPDDDGAGEADSLVLMRPNATIEIGWPG